MSLDASSPPDATPTPKPPTAGERLIALDQFRGYTVLGMFLVNFLGAFAATPELLRHTNRYCGYADTIMPHFFFAVGFAFRLTWQRRVDRDGLGPARWHTLRRNLLLLGIGVLLYGFDRPAKDWASLTELGVLAGLLKATTGSTFQTLVHIAVTALWILPLIGRSWKLRAFALVASAALHVGLSHSFYFGWTQSHRTIDGGVLGFVSWAIPMLAGTLACDAVQSRGPVGARGRVLIGGLILMAAGYALSCVGPLRAGGDPLLAAPPFDPAWHPLDIWTMSQKTGAASYQLFGAGLSLLVFALTLELCERRRWSLGVFRTLGQNALAGYVLHIFTGRLLGALLPKDAPGPAVAVLLVLFLMLTIRIMQALERRGLYWKL